MIFHFRLLRKAIAFKKSCFERHRFQNDLKIGAIDFKIISRVNKMASLTDSILSFPLKEKKLFIAAFYGKIIFGMVEKNYFCEGASVVLEHFEIVDFYCVLIKILHCAAHGPFPSNKLEYQNTYWQVKSPQQLVFVINNDRDINFTSNGFNDFLECLAKLIYPSLALKEEEKFLFHFASSLNPTEIVKLNDIPFVTQFITSIKSNYGLNSLDQYNSFLLLSRYRDLILVQKKLMSIFVSNQCDKNIELILKTN